MAAAIVGKTERGSRQTGRRPAIKKGLPVTWPAGLSQTGCNNYLCSGAAVDVVVVTVDVTVDVIADCSTAFGASCFWHPLKARTAATAETAMIAVIFFIVFHPLSLMKFTAMRLSQ
jgi:hypothetical protein